MGIFVSIIGPDTATIENCTFLGTPIAAYGQIYLNHKGQCTIRDCVFAGSGAGACIQISEITGNPLSPLARDTITGCIARSDCVQGWLSQRDGNPHHVVVRVLENESKIRRKEAPSGVESGRLTDDDPSLR